MSVRIELFVEAPGPKWQGLISWRRQRSLHVPGAKQRANRLLVTAQNLHVDVLMFPRLLPEEEVNGPSARDPLQNGEGGEEARDILWTPGQPCSPGVRLIAHLFASPRPANLLTLIVAQRRWRHKWRKACASVSRVMPPS
jgi:hypothetical protein